MVAIVDVKPSMRSKVAALGIRYHVHMHLPGEGDSVGEGVVLVASSPEEDTRADTLAVEPIEGVYR